MFPPTHGLFLLLLFIFSWLALVPHNAFVLFFALPIPTLLLPFYFLFCLFLNFVFLCHFSLSFLTCCTFAISHFFIVFVFPSIYWLGFFFKLCIFLFKFIVFFFITCKTLKTPKLIKILDYNTVKGLTNIN